MADDVDIPPEAVAWIEHEARTFFESGGVELPRPHGLEGSEIHVFYDLAREDAKSSTAVMMAALAKTLGAAPPPTAPPPETGRGAAAAAAEPCAGHLAPPADAGPAAGPPAAPAVVDPDARECLVQSVGSADSWPSLASGLAARGLEPSLAGLRACHRDDPAQLRQLIAQLDLKVGQRQRLFAALGEQPPVIETMGVPVRRGGLV
eukprot:scaffold41827_cov191-Isochrysis_galbana.AAC.1